jgi:hypothetical protein
MERRHESRFQTIARQSVLALTTEFQQFKLFGRCVSNLGALAIFAGIFAVSAQFPRHVFAQQTSIDDVQRQIEAKKQKKAAADRERARQQAAAAAQAQADAVAAKFRVQAQSIMGRWAMTKTDRNVKDTENSYKEACIYSGSTEVQLVLDKFNEAKNVVSGTYSYNYRDLGGTYDPDARGRPSPSYDRHTDKCADAHDKWYRILSSSVFITLEPAKDTLRLERIEENCSGVCNSFNPGHREEQIEILANGQIEYRDDRLSKR